MNKHAESLRNLAPRLNDANRSIDGPTLLEAAAEIERLESAIMKERNLSDTLAAAIFGDIPKLDALIEYNKGLADTMPLSELKARIK